MKRLLIITTFFFGQPINGFQNKYPHKKTREPYNQGSNKYRISHVWVKWFNIFPKIKHTYISVNEPCKTNAYANIKKHFSCASPHKSNIKYFLLTTFFFAAIVCNAQEIKCDSGYKYFPSIGTSSLIIEGGIPIIMGSFSASDIGFHTGNGASNLLYLSHANHWNDSTKACEIHPKWQKLIKGEWIDITKEEYNKIIASIK